MKTIKTVVYNFDELADDVQDEVVEKFGDINVDFCWWDCDGLLDLTAREMKDRHIKLSDNWQDSDKPKDANGNIEGEYPAHTGLVKYKLNGFDIEKGYIRFSDIEIMADDIFRKFLRIPKRLWRHLTWDITGGFKSNWYGDISSRMEMEFDFWDGRDSTQRQDFIVGRAIDIMNGKVDEALSILRKEYEYLTSRGQIVETIEINEFEFTAKGEFTRKAI